MHSDTSSLQLYLNANSQTVYLSFPIKSIGDAGLFLYCKRMQSMRYLEERKMSTASIATTPNALVTAIRAAGHGLAAFTHAALENIGNAFTRSMEESRRETDEAYLAQSADRFDLERRMRELDRGSRGALAGMY